MLFFQEKKNLYIYGGISIVVVLLLVFFLISLGSGKLKKTLGVQIITSEGTVFLGRNKYSKELSAWYSPLVGFFNSRSYPVFFGEEEHVENYESQSSSDSEWSLDLRWVDLTVNDQDIPFLNLKPQEIELSQEVLEESCVDEKARALGCEWDVFNDFEYRFISSDYLCVTLFSRKDYGGAHPIYDIRYQGIDLSKKQPLDVWSLFPEESNSRMQVYQKLYTNVQLQFLTDGKQLIKSSEGLSETELKSKITAVLSSVGYKFNEDNVCLLVQPAGPQLLFGFSPVVQAKQKKALLEMEVALGQVDVPSEVRSYYHDKQFLKGANDLWSKVVSPDEKWRIAQSGASLEVSFHDKKKMLTLPQGDFERAEVLGIVWVYKSPSLLSLNKYKFREIKLKKGQPIELN